MAKYFPVTIKVKSRYSEKVSEYSDWRFRNLKEAVDFCKEQYKFYKKISIEYKKFGIKKEIVVIENMNVCAGV